MDARPGAIAGGWLLQSGLSGSVFPENQNIGIGGRDLFNLQEDLRIASDSPKQFLADDRIFLRSTRKDPLSLIFCGGFHGWWKQALIVPGFYHEVSRPFFQGNERPGQYLRRP